MTIFISVLLIGSAVSVIYYFADFYLRGSVHVLKEDWYIKFQNAFPPADLWMAACALAGAVGLLTEQTYGLVFTLMAASAMIFLGLMDITFNVQNKLYSLVATSSQMKLEVVLNLLCLLIGIGLIIYVWPKLVTA
jgi:hypothetical protein